MHERLDCRRWRHDAYTLRALQAGVQRALRRVIEHGALGGGRGTVVDLGAGDASYRTLFAPHSSRYVTRDIEPREGIDVVLDDGVASTLEAGSADCEVSFQVLEHVLDVGRYPGECRRLLGPEGYLLLSTHGTWLYHPHPGDFRRWTRDGLCCELALHGFRVESMDPIVGPLAWTTQFRTLAYCHVLSRLGVPGRLAAGAVALVMYARMAIEDRITPAALRENNAAVYCVTARPMAPGTQTFKRCAY